MYFDTTRRALIWVGVQAMQGWGLKVRLSTKASRYLYERRGALYDLPLYSEQLFAMMGSSVDLALTTLVGDEWSDRPEVVAAALVEGARALRVRVSSLWGGDSWAPECVLSMKKWELNLTTAHGDNGPSASLKLSLGGAIGYDEMDPARRLTLHRQVAPSLGCYLCAFDRLFVDHGASAHTREATIEALVQNLDSLRIKLRS